MYVCGCRCAFRSHEQCALWMPPGCVPSVQSKTLVAVTVGEKRMKRGNIRRRVCSIFQYNAGAYFTPQRTHSNGNLVYYGLEPPTQLMSAPIEFLGDTIAHMLTRFRSYGNQGGLFFGALSVQPLSRPSASRAYAPPAHKLFVFCCLKSYEFSAIHMKDAMASESCAYTHVQEP